MSRTSKKKSYRELRADPFIKTPLLAWILDRKALYISLALVAFLASGNFVYKGWESYQSIIAPPKVNSPYLAINPTESEGARWATSFLKDSHGIEGWKLTGITQPSHGFIQDATGGTAGDVPITLLSTQLASAGPVKAVAQVYGAGQARKQYDSYVAKLSTRGSVDSKQVSDTGIFGAKFDQGFILVAGDAIVGAQTPDNGLRDRLFNEYLTGLKGTLPASGCVSVSAVDESRRSVYFDPKSFEGLQETKKINSQVNTDYLPTFESLGTSAIGDPYAAAPEGPLPASLPALPAEVAKPTLANAPALMDDFTGVASYRVQDPIGPGCGWKWSAQNPLKYDEASLKATEDNTVTKTQNEVNDKTQSYVDSQVSWARIVALMTPKLDDWNGYVKEVNTVHGRWAKLVSDREALRPAWDTYIANYQNWSTFDARKAAADKSYNDSLTQCVADRKAHDAWEKEWGPEPLKKKQDEWRKEQEALNPKPTPTPSATPTPGATATPDPSPSATAEPTTPYPTAPTEPTDCTVDPQKPSILSEAKPAKPAAPAIPDDVTIPSSWPKAQ